MCYAHCRESELLENFRVIVETRVTVNSESACSRTTFQYKFNARVIGLTFGWWLADQFQILVHHTIVTLALLVRIFQIIIAFRCPPRKFQFGGVLLYFKFHVKDENLKVQRTHTLTKGAQ